MSGGQLNVAMTPAGIFISCMYDEIFIEFQDLTHLATPRFVAGNPYMYCALGLPRGCRSTTGLFGHGPHDSPSCTFQKQSATVWDCLTPRHMLVGEVVDNHLVHGSEGSPDPDRILGTDVVSVPIIIILSSHVGLHIWVVVCHADAGRWFQVLDLSSSLFASRI